MIDDINVTTEMNTSHMLLQEVCENEADAKPPTKNHNLRQVMSQAEWVRGAQYKIKII